MDELECVYIENLGSSLVREYLFRKGLSVTLECMDRELPRCGQSFNSRTRLAKELNIELLVHENKLTGRPFRSMLELIVHQMMVYNEKTSSIYNLQKVHAARVDEQWRRNRCARSRIIDRDSASFKVFKMKTLQKKLLERRDSVDFKKLMRSITTLAGRAHGFERNENGEPSEDSPLADYSHSNARDYRDKSPSPLREKEHVLLSSLGAKVDFSPVDNSARLGPNKCDTFQCLKEETVTADTNVANNNNDNCYETLGCKSKFQALNCFKTDTYKYSSDGEQDALKDEPTSVETEKSVVNECDVTQLSLSNGTQQKTNYSEVKSNIKTKQKLDNFVIKNNKTIVNNLDAQSSVPSDPSECFSDRDEVTINGFAALPLETLIHLKNLLLRCPTAQFPLQWLGQSFLFNSNADLRYGFIQSKSGPCGVLATVQGFVVRSLLLNGSTEPLRPSRSQVTGALSQAIADILWQAGGSEKAVLAISLDSSRWSLYDGSNYRPDGVTEALYSRLFTTRKELDAAVLAHMSQFTVVATNACLLLLISAILSRGIQLVLSDMDEDSNPLIGSNGHCSLELVMLLLTGQAVSNVFDNNLQLDSCLLKGVSRRAEVGLLSLYEHHNSCQVGSNLKTPRLPIWVINSENHFAVLFSCRRDLVSDWRAEKQFNLYYYDTMSSHTREVKLIIDTTGHRENEETEAGIPLEHCIRTKWKDAAISWG